MMTQYIIIVNDNMNIPVIFGFQPNWLLAGDQKFSYCKSNHSLYPRDIKL